MTAQQFIKQFNTDSELAFSELHGVDATEDTINLMVAFAKYHVEKAQEAASARNRLKVTSGWGRYNNQESRNVSYTAGPINHEHPGHGDCTYEIVEPDRSIIFEVYPLENIQ